MLAACAFSGSQGTVTEDDLSDRIDEDDAGVDLEMVLINVSGNVADFISGDAVSDVSLEGVDLSDGTIEVTGSTFTITGVVPHSIFRLKATAAGYAPTISGLIAVGDTDVTDLTVEIVAQSMVDAVHTEANITPTKGLVAARLLDVDAKTPVVGVSGGAFTDGAPVFLDGNKTADAGVPSSTSSGLVFLADVDAGLINITSALPDQHFFVAPTTRVEDGAVSVVNIDVGAEAPQIPTNANYIDVLGVLDRRGCNNCHRDGGPGEGALDLGGRLLERYDRIVMRVDTAEPEASLLLRKPSFEDPVDGHQVVFANTFDPDYLTLLGWVMSDMPLL